MIWTLLYSINLCGLGTKKGKKKIVKNVSVLWVALRCIIVISVSFSNGIACVLVAFLPCPALQYLIFVFCNVYTYMKI